MERILDLNLNFSTNKNTIVRIKRNFNDCGIFLKHLSRNYNEYLNDEFPEAKEYKIIDFDIRSEDFIQKIITKNLLVNYLFLKLMRKNIVALLLF